MAILGFELEEIARLLALMEAQGLEEFIYEDGDRSLRIRGPRHPKSVRPQTVVAAAPMVTEAPAAPRQRAIAPPGRRNPVASVPSEDQIILSSPMVGVFYRASQPGQSAFVEVGQAVTVKQPIGMIEAMKVFSVIEAEHAGVIVSIPAKDGQLVQAGEPLVILKKA